MTIMTYEIGYGKPPKNTRFKQGNKEHLKRRSRRKPRDVAAIISDTSKLPVEYREGGRTRKATWSELSFRALVRRAASGNLRSMELIDLHCVDFVSVLHRPNAGHCC